MSTNYNNVNYVDETTCTPNKNRENESQMNSTEQTTTSDPTSVGNHQRNESPDHEEKTEAQPKILPSSSGIPAINSSENIKKPTDSEEKKKKKKKRKKAKKNDKDRARSKDVGEGVPPEISATGGFDQVPTTSKAGDGNGYEGAGLDSVNDSVDNSTPEKRNKKKKKKKKKKGKTYDDQTVCDTNENGDNWEKSLDYSPRDSWTEYRRKILRKEIHRKI